MPPIINQGKFGNCTQASGISYVFAYEINCMRNVDAKQSEENQYSELFTYSMLRAFEGQSILATDGWDILKEIGCPNRKTYNPSWMNGYDKYYAAMQNRVESYMRIDVSTEEGIIALKKWLYNHNNDSEHGGIVSFGINIIDHTNLHFNSTSPNGANGYYVFIPSTNMLHGHMMTIVGYDDNTEFDYNGDGKITNNIDITGDGKVTIADWEKGAFKIANSWGIWGNNNSIKDTGYVYMSYRYCDQLLENAITRGEVYVVIPRADKKAEVTAKISINYPKRSEVFVVCNSKNSGGSSSFVPNVFKQSMVSSSTFSGDNSNPTLEIGLDLSGNGLNNLGNSKISIGLFEFDQTHKYQGYVSDFSIFDYRNNQVFEVKCEQDKVLTQDLSANMLNIDYYLLPSSVSENLTIKNNSILRNNLNVTSNKSIILKDNSPIAIYNTTLTIAQGATLTVGNNTKIVGKAGNPKIIINGTLNIVGNFSIENCEIELNGTITSTSGALAIDGGMRNITVKKQIIFPSKLSSATLKNAKILMTNSNSELYMSSGIGNVIIDNVNVTSSTGKQNNHQGIDIRCNNFSITNSSFQYGQYGLYIARAFAAPTMPIKNCSFSNNTNGLATACGAYNISNCTFKSNGYSIQVNATVGVTNVENCSINGGTYGVYAYGQGTGCVNLKNNTIKGTQEAVYATNSAYLRLKCNDLQNNYVGVRLQNNSEGYFTNSGSIEGGYNNFTNCNYGILGGSTSTTNRKNRFYIENGRNNLRTGSYAISGMFQSITTSTYNCGNNYWKNSSNCGTVTGLNGTVKLYDNSPLTYFNSCANSIIAVNGRTTLKAAKKQTYNDLKDATLEQQINNAIELDKSSKEESYTMLSNIMKKNIILFSDDTQAETMNRGYYYARQQLAEIVQDSTGNHSEKIADMELIQDNVAKVLNIENESVAQQIIERSQTMFLDGKYDEAVEYLENEYYKLSNDNEKCALESAICQTKILSELAQNPETEGDLLEKLKECKTCENNDELLFKNQHRIKRRLNAVENEDFGTTDGEIEMHISPNPATDFVQVEINNAIDCQLIIKSSYGQEIISFIIDNDCFTKQIQTSDLAIGSYIFSVVYNNKTLLSEIIIVK